MKTQQDPHGLNGLIFTLMSIVTWLIPIVGIPVSILALVFTIRGHHVVKPVLIVVASITLLAGGINAYIGAVQGSEINTSPAQGSVPGFERNFN